VKIEIVIEDQPARVAENVRIFITGVLTWLAEDNAAWPPLQSFLARMAREDPPDPELAAWFEKMTRRDIATLCMFFMNGWRPGDLPEEEQLPAAAAACTRQAEAVARATFALKQLPPAVFTVPGAVDAILRRLYAAGADDMTAAAFTAVESALAQS
jgi:hypothetical protein